MPVTLLPYLSTIPSTIYIKIINILCIFFPIVSCQPLQYLSTNIIHIFRYSIFFSFNTKTNACQPSPFLVNHPLYHAYQTSALTYSYACQPYTFLVNQHHSYIFGYSNFFSVLYLSTIAVLVNQHHLHIMDFFIFFQFWIIQYTYYITNNSFFLSTIAGHVNQHDLYITDFLFSFSFMIFNVLVNPHSICKPT
jgi:hypothetical protein